VVESCLILVLHRLDLEFALQNGSPARFRADDMPGSKALEGIGTRQKFENTTRYLDWCRGVHPKLSTLIVDITNFADALNHSKMDPLDYSEASLLLLHRLIEFAPFDELRPIYGLDNQVHLTLLAFMAGLLPDYGHNHCIYVILVDRLRKLLQRLVVTAGQRQKLTLWTLFVCGVSVLDRKDHNWLLPLLANTCRALNLSSWLCIRKTLCECSWICAVHDKPGRVLWELVDSLKGN